MPHWQFLSRWAAVPVVFLMAYPAALLLVGAASTFNVPEETGGTGPAAIMSFLLPYAALAVGSYFAVTWPAITAPSYRIQVAAAAAIFLIILWSALFGFVLAGDIGAAPFIDVEADWMAVAPRFLIAVFVAIYSAFDFRKGHR